ncbi:MAG: histidine phosphatase family protein [Ignavibacteria bacterium]|nr:histidine phosphatase family protein [Ignavibacteria bacterium]
MKNLILVRHAKSSWDDAGLSDMERPLNKRGRHDAPMMGRILAEKGEKPDLIISSPAKRALSTAKRIADELGYDRSSIKINNSLYMADNDDFFSVIRDVKDKVSRLMIFSHNYGITDFANHITGESISNIPTCGIVKAELDMDSWTDILNTKGKLLYFEYPKKHTNGI